MLAELYLLLLFSLVNSDKNIILNNNPSDFYQQLNAWPDFQLAAFTDLNADRRMDIIFANGDGSKLFAVLQSDNKGFQSTSSILSSVKFSPPVEIIGNVLPKPVRGVATSDFNGDSRIDLLLVTGSSDGGPFDVYVAYGLSGENRGKFDSPKFLDTFTSQPLVCDLNSDMIADVYGEVSGHRVAYIGGNKLTKLSATYSGPSWSRLGYSAFGDINGDGVPDIVILVDNENRQQLQVILRTQSSIGSLPDVANAELIDLDPKLLSTPQSVLGLFVLNDFDYDGLIDLLLPVCRDAKCLDTSSINMYSFRDRKWSPVNVIWEPSNVKENTMRWSLTSTPQIKSGLLTSSLIGPAVGDVNMDGKPDLGLGVTSWSENGQNMGVYPGVFVNKGLNSNGILTFQLTLVPGVQLPPDNSRLRQLAFFDQSDDSILDFFIVSLNSHDQPSAQLFLSTVDTDPYFLKVTVLNGLCSSADSCSDGKLPYGLTVPGISSNLNTEAAAGGRHLSAALLSSQSCCSALQVPFAIFGLGQFANYVEKLTISIPPSKELIRSRLLSFIVPKAQIVINPYPLDNPSAWTMKLFLQPLYNMKVLYIAITLLCICILLVIIIGILQWFEFREDRLEKQKESQRFHFDAM
ncbi:T-cell immunomodulatory protein [Schistosoma mansoni]|uniref:T-cell immunomodulatory protein n=1 Tax=Schistosoma mansoni TaxID=6183 RepID=UPI00022DCA4D|nr:T-cell immunomodulatory protein [Schistosoma mansoni]|eukprot:XP_018655324.1 T-cell immunomodulatory protein [Schistosoma mansoni]